MKNLLIDIAMLPFTLVGVLAVIMFIVAASPFLLIGYMTGNTVFTKTDGGFEIEYKSYKDQ